jgi:TLC domain
MNLAMNFSSHDDAYYILCCGYYLQHHFVAIAYLSGPVLWPEYRWFMGACLSVEINTWFLILRRVLFKRKAAAHWQSLVAGGFYFSWILLRVILFPLIMYLFCFMARDRIVETGVWFHWPMIFMPVHFFLCVLNLKWTYDLFLPPIKQFWEGSLYGRQQQQPQAISSGL